MEQEERAEDDYIISGARLGAGGANFYTINGKSGASVCRRTYHVRNFCRLASVPRRKCCYFDIAHAVRMCSQSKSRQIDLHLRSLSLRRASHNVFPSCTDTFSSPTIETFSARIAPRIRVVVATSIPPRLKRLLLNTRYILSPRQSELSPARIVPRLRVVAATSIPRAFAIYAPDASR